MQPWQSVLKMQRMRGSGLSAAGGRNSEVSEWQRSIKSRISVSPMILPGTATGIRLNQGVAAIQLAASNSPPDGYAD